MKKVDIHNLSTCSEQEVFDFIANHLFEQGRDCLDEDGGCVYRNEMGLKCAAGCLIPDNVYKSDFEGKRWLELATIGLVPREHSYLITELQDIHDAVPFYNWKKRLEKFAEKYNLEFNFK